MVEQRTGVGVLGLGLMGGSLLRRLAAAGFAAVGWDADPPTGSLAATAGLTVAPSLADLVSASSTVFVAVPLPALQDVFESVAAVAQGQLVVSDLSSVKQPVRALAGRHGFAFVGGHPMAGSAESGFAASDAGMLEGCRWVLTLDEETDLAAWLGVAATVTALGCQVVPTTSAEHDVAVARISHLPHLLAGVLVAAAGQDPLALSLAADSFRDATRVTATRPELVAQMCAANAGALAPEVAATVSRLVASGDALRQPDELVRLFAAAQAVRRAWPPKTPVEQWLPADGDLRQKLLGAGNAGGHVARVTRDGVLVRTPETA